MKPTKPKEKKVPPCEFVEPKMSKHSKKGAKLRLRKAEKLNPNLPTHFKPQLLDGLDGRPHLVKVLKRRLADLVEDSGVDSTQKNMLAQRAVFLQCKIETTEVIAATTGRFDIKNYVAMVNCLQSMLKSLGLEKKGVKAVSSLATYVKKKKVYQRELNFYKKKNKKRKE